MRPCFHLRVINRTPIMSSFRIVSVISLVLISCILQSCSTPIVTITRNDEASLVLLDGSGSVPDDQPKETFSQLISSILSPVFNRLLLLFLRELMSLMIGMEIMTISTGHHFGMIVPQLSKEADLELHQSAMAVMELWLQLPTVENIESALQKATSDVGELVGHSILKDVPVEPDVTQRIMQLILEKIEQRLKDDPPTYNKLLEAKTRIKAQFVKLHDDHRTYFNSGEKMTLKSETEVYRQWYSHQKVKTFLVNKLFAEHCLKRVPRAESPDYEYVLLAKAMVRLAKVPEKYAEVNRIYQAVVAEVAQEFDFEKFKLRSSSSMGGFSSAAFSNKTIPILFKRLNDKCSENSTLYNDLVNQRTNVIGDAFMEDFPFPKTGFW